MKKFAIVIGINEYKRRGDLLYAEGDASEFADSLVRYCGFSYDEIALLISGVNGDERVVLEDVQAQISRAKERGELETFVFFFCGRSRLDDDRTTRRFCFSGAEDGELLDSSFTLPSLLESLRGVQASNGLFFFDGRASEGEYATMRELNAFDDFAEGVASLWKKSETDAPNVLAINAASNGQTSYDDAEYERGLAASHLTWLLMGCFTSEAPTFAQLSELLPKIVAARAVELRVGERRSYKGDDYVAQRPCCALIGDGSFTPSIKTISEEERSARVGVITRFGEQLFEAKEFERARLAADRALEMSPNSEEARSLKNRAYRAEVSLVGADKVFEATNAIIGLTKRRVLSDSMADKARLIGKQTLKTIRSLTDFKEKGTRIWKIGFGVVFLFVFYVVVAHLIASYFIPKDEPRILPRDVWVGAVAGDFQLLMIDDVRFPFRYCPPGTFKMGSPWFERGRVYDERRHRVTLTKGFWILQTETTQEMWRLVSDENISYFEGDNLPVDQSSWYDCQKFVAKLNQRGVAPRGWKFSLPTEAQWEYACRAGESEYRVLSRLDEYAWNWNNAAETREPGGKKANAWGVYDMRGNLWEWCADVYAPFLGRATVDPKGPPEREGSMHVLRGGCWGSDDFDCRSAARYPCFSSKRESYYGFRLVLIPLEADERDDE